MSATPLSLTRESRPATQVVEACDEHGRVLATAIAGEHPLTLYLDKRELVTLMTLGAEPEYLALGYLFNQRLIDSIESIASVQVDWEVQAASVTSRSLADRGVPIWADESAAALDERLSQRTMTTGCGQGTVFGQMMQDLESLPAMPEARLAQVHLYGLMDRIRRLESIYKEAGAVHGCALCTHPAAAEPQVLRFVEDVGRHNAVDAIAGWMRAEGVSGADKVFYTTGRLTSEMVIKCAQMGIPILVSRSGLTGMGHDLAQRLGLLMVGRCQGRHYRAFTGAERLIRTDRGAITGVVLAGGLGRRMARDGIALDKGLRSFRGQPLAAHVIERLKPQVGSLAVNANRQLDEWTDLGYPVFADEFPDFAGPLAGLHAALARVQTEWVITVPCDAPLLPGDLVDRLAWAALQTNADIAIARTGGQLHPVFALVRRRLRDSLEAFLAAGGRRIDRWTSTQACVEVDFDDETAFTNLNTPEDLQRLESPS